jgi:transcriptional regulator with XRE-family HTH domain
MGWMKRLAHWIYRPVVWETSFDILYLAVQRGVIDYWEWLLSFYPEDVLREAKEVFGQTEAPKVLEKSLYFSSSTGHKSVEDWWWETFSNISMRIAGGLAVIRIMQEAAKDPDFPKNKLIFNFGDFKPFNGRLSHWGLDGKRDSKEEEALINVFVSKRWNYPIKLIDLLKDEFYYSYGGSTYTSFGKRYDKTANWFTKIFETISELHPVEALRMYFGGTLRNYIAKRAADRMKNYITAERAQKRGGRSPKEIGQMIRKAREEQNMTLLELASATNYKEGFLKQIEEGKHSKLYNSTILRIANHLNIDTDKVLGRTKTVYIDFQEEAEAKGEDEPFIRSIQVTYDDTINWDFVKKIEDKDMREGLQRLYSEDSTEYKLLEHIFTQSTSRETRKEFANKIRYSERWVREVGKKVQADPALRKILEDSGITLFSN